MCHKRHIFRKYFELVWLCVHLKWKKQPQQARCMHQQEHMKNHAIYFKSKTCEITQNLLIILSNAVHFWNDCCCCFFFPFVLSLSVDCNWIVIRVIPICSVDLFSIMDLSRWTVNIHTHQGGEAHTHTCAIWGYSYDDFCVGCSFNTFHLLLFFCFFRM